MEIYIKHEIDLSPATQAFLTALFSAMGSGAPVAASAAPAPAKGAAKSKTVPLTGAETTDTATEPQDTITTEREITLDDVKSIFAKKKAEGKNDKLTALVKSCSAKGLADLKPNQYLYVFTEASKY